MDAPPTMTVGDKWTYQFHDQGNKRDPYLYTNEVQRVDALSAWLYSETQDPAEQTPKSIWRYDLKRAGLMERFAFSETAPNGVGSRVNDRQKNDDLLQFPLEVGKKYAVKWFWRNENGEGYTDYKAEVEAFEKVRVLAGEFDAFRIKYSGWWNANSFTGRAEMTVWYAPAGKREVKVEYLDRTRGNRTRGNQLWNQRVWQLVQWEPAGSRPAPPAPAASGAASAPR